jgi:hypothetical protein
MDEEKPVRVASSKSTFFIARKGMKGAVWLNENSLFLGMETLSSPDGSKKPLLKREEFLVLRIKIQRFLSVLRGLFISL